MDQVLLYTTIGYSEKYLDLFELYCESLCFSTPSMKHLLVIADEKFVDRIHAIGSRYSLLKLYIMPVSNSKSSEEASMQKTRIFEFSLIHHFKICLYVDVDCLFLDNLFKIFQFPVHDGKLYVFAESSKIEDNLMRWFSLTRKTGESYYSKEDIDFLRKENKYPFNAGLFMFKISHHNAVYFKGLRNFIQCYDGNGFYEQSYMNTFFNLNGMTDFSYFLESVAMQSTHLIDPSIVKTFSPFDDSTRKPINKNHLILHFNATSPGKGILKMIGMRRYLDQHKKTKIHRLTTFEKFENMIEAIIPEGSIIAEIGELKNDFSRNLLKMNPALLQLIQSDNDSLTDILRQFRFNSNVVGKTESTKNSLDTFADLSLDVLFIHSNNDLSHILETALKKVKKYGLIVGQNYTTSPTTVEEVIIKKEVDEFCIKYNMVLYSITNDKHFVILNNYITYQLNLFQFIAISVNKEREQTIRKQCFDMFPSIKLTFINSHNDIGYFPLTVSTKDKKIIDCAVNHFKAIKMASDSTSPEFSIIIEDDVSFHKDSFYVIEDLLLNWELYMQSDSIASIGWVPLKKHSEYKDFDNNLEYFEKYKISSKFFSVGTQSYVVRKKDISKYIEILNKPTYEEFLNQIRLLKLAYTDNNLAIMPSDYILPRLMGQRTLFPPIVIERETSSLLGHTNSKHWDNYFSGRDDLKKEYYGY